MATATLLDESLELVLSFEDARKGIKSKFSTFRMLLGRREEELLAQIDLLESKNSSILEPLIMDLRKLELTLQQMEHNLKANTLNQFRLRQTQEIKEQIRKNEEGIFSLSSVSLLWELTCDNFDTIGQVSSFRTHRYERDMIKPLLEVKPEYGDVRYVVSGAWFQQWRLAVRMDTSSSSMKDDNRKMDNIPIDNVAILGKDLDSVDIVSLHTEAWKLLLCWHGLSEGSYPISFLVNLELELHSNPVHSKLRYSYRITQGNNRGNVHFTYLYPTQTFQELFDVVMKDVICDRSNVQLQWRSKRRRNSFIRNYADTANSVTDLTKQIGTDTNIRFYFII